MPRFNAPDGTELFYRDWGSGRPVVFVHSMLMSSDMWQHHMLHLARNGFRAVAYDRRGHGRSDESASGYGFDTLADDLATLVDLLDLTDVTLVGHSMGGGEVIRYLTRHGVDRIDRFALVGSTAPALGVEPAVADAVVAQLADGYVQWVTDNADLSFGASTAIPQLDKDRTIREWLSVSLDAALACTAANLVADFQAELARIPLPALVVHGDSDAFAPLETCGRRSFELAQDAELKVYPNASHMLHLSHRDELASDLLEFAAKGQCSVPLADDPR